MAKKKKVAKKSFKVDFAYYEKRVLARLRRDKTVTPADVVAMALPVIMSQAAFMLRTLVERDAAIESYADDAGIVIQEDQ